MIIEQRFREKSELITAYDIRVPVEEKGEQGTSG
jgi:hypothetical protein